MILFWFLGDALLYQGAAACMPTGYSVQWLVYRFSCARLPSNICLSHLLRFGCGHQTSRIAVMSVNVSAAVSFIDKKDGTLRKLSRWLFRSSRGYRADARAHTSYKKKRFLFVFLRRQVHPLCIYAATINWLLVLHICKVVFSQEAGKKKERKSSKLRSGTCGRQPHCIFMMGDGCTAGGRFSRRWRRTATGWTHSVLTRRRTLSEGGRWVPGYQQGSIAH